MVRIVRAFKVTELTEISRYATLGLVATPSVLSQSSNKADTASQFHTNYALFFIQLLLLLYTLRLVKMFPRQYHSVQLRYNGDTVVWDGRRDGVS